MKIFGVRNDEVRKKYQVKTLSNVERDFLNSIEQLKSKTNND